MGTPENSREPCPDRILDDMGGAFAMGAGGGSAFHFIKGVYNSPQYHRLSGGAQAVRMNAPRVGGSFAVWGGLFSVFDCTFVYARQKEDPWNSIMAGAATGGLLSMRKGLRAASGSALVGGVLLAAIEGAGIMLQKVMSAQQNIPVVIDDSIPNMAGGGAGFQVPNKSEQSDTSSWFGGWFGGKKEESKEGRGFKTEVLESFDSPVPPTFEFNYSTESSEDIAL
ncbi:hypothetical protein Vadar_013202 [Vaccinium darrowii]|uniref:Uncharacterized protein n=1 Tax=Vaccinium darrowii TaxID=229202 RepID=A0ACB7YDC4_9ERIC|nr:hypothetical protein Vadar_013202 [Vaccinium darrowii]